MAKHVRKKLFIDRKVQGALLAQMVRFWVLHLATVGGLTLLGWMFISPGLDGFIGTEAFMVEVLPMCLMGVGVSVLVLPVLLYDMLKVSHRFSGPIVRLKRQLNEAAAGGPLQMLNFRDGDYWTEIADSYNALLTRFEQELEEASGSCCKQEPEVVTDEQQEVEMLDNLSELNRQAQTAAEAVPPTPQAATDQQS